MRLEMVRISNSRFSLLKGKEKAIFLAKTPTMKTSKIKATINPGSKPFYKAYNENSPCNNKL